MASDEENEVAETNEAESEEVEEAEGEAEVQENDEDVPPTEKEDSISVNIPFISPAKIVEKGQSITTNPWYWGIGIVVIILLGVGAYFVVTKLVLKDSEIPSVKLKLDDKYKKDPIKTAADELDKIKKIGGTTGKVTVTTARPGGVKSPMANGVTGPGAVKKPPVAAAAAVTTVKPSIVKSPSVMVAAVTTAKPLLSKPTPVGTTTTRRVA